MAKMWKVEGVDCGRGFAWNAHRAIGVRVAEVYAHEGALADPHDSQGMHDMRISVKRLRYSLEFFAPCYAATEVSPLLDALSELQDYLGDLHDADVLIPEFQRTLRRMTTSARRLVERRCSTPRRSRKALTLERFRQEMVRGSATRNQAGVLSAINRMRTQRHESYRAALALWRRMAAEGFRERLEGLGRSSDVLASAPPIEAEPQPGIAPPATVVPDVT